MNKNLKKIMHRLFLNKFSWTILKPIIFFSERLKAAKLFSENHEMNLTLSDKARSVLPGNAILHGPFSGMIYHNSLPTGSSFFAKKLGSYEKEIQPFIYDVFKTKYGQVINIGSDEGFYAIGFAKKLRCPVIAFDISKVAREQCKKLAELNELSSLLRLKKKCTISELLNIDYTPTTLIIADCEGDEASLFTVAIAAELKYADIIIELHLQQNPEILETLKQLFHHSHEHLVVNSVDDHMKVSTYNYAELTGLNYQEKRYILEEREVFMQWLYLKSNSIERSSE